jgi:hypothetical protein
MAVDDSEASGSLADVGSTETSSRDDVAAAFDAVEARDQPKTDAPAEAAPAGESPAREGRDAAGRFTPKRDAPAAAPEAAPAQGPQVGAQPALADAPQVPPRLAKPPASWSQAESAHWEKVPVEVREAVARRESEVQRVMQEAASARQGLSQLQQTIAPYVPNIQAANGGDVVGAIKTFFDYDNRLRHGSQIEKARAVTALIKGYGIDIGTLDSELAGAQHSPQQTQQDMLKAALERELAPMREFLSQQREAQAAQQQSLAQEVSQSITAFGADPAHPHYGAVRSDMADLLEIATQQGRKMSLQEAYERACWQNPEVRNILIAGQQSAGAQAQHQAAQRARSAAVGVRNAPRAGAPSNGATPPEQRSRADDIAAAFAHHAGEA